MRAKKVIFMGAYAPILESLFLLSCLVLSAVVRNGSQIVINYISYINKWSCHVILDQTQAWSILSNSIKLVKTCPNLSKLVQTCQTWCQLVKIGPNLVKLVKTCQNWFEFVKIGSIW